VTRLAVLIAVDRIGQQPMGGPASLVVGLAVVAIRTVLGRARLVEQGGLLGTGVAIETGDGQGQQYK
jgi:hypothetical protein